MSNLYALLIGVDHYFAYPLPGNIAYRSLGGCVRDIEKVYGFLTNRIKMPAANITKLTASVGAGQPLEPQSQWPTYLNMVNAFQELAAKVSAGDQVYIQYSGHGGRTTTMFPGLKGEGAFDEGLVPPDIGKPGDANARYLRDVELHNLIQALVDKDVRLTVVFDCCHSGGVTRNAGGAVKRGISEPDLSPPPSDSAVGTIPDLISRWTNNGAATARSVTSESSWLFEAKDYTLFAACRANESAFEFPFDGRESNGALTYWMLDTLAQSGPETTWQMVADRVTAKVHGQFKLQAPMLQGEGNFKVFGAEELESRFGVSVLEAKSNGLVRIAAGEAHGLAKGTQFAVFPTMADVDDPTKRQALIELEETGATDSWASIIEPTSGATVEVGSQAVMMTTTAVRVQRQVRVVIQDATLRNQIEAAIQNSGQGFLAVASEGASADFLVDLHEDRPNEYVLLDTAGGEIPKMRPALQVGDANAIPQLVKRLIHLTQFSNVETLDMPDSRMATKLRIDIEQKVVYKPGDKVSFKIVNTQEPNTFNPNDPERILNITVLALSSDWSITQLYPSGASPFEPLDPGGEIPLELTAYLPEGQSDSTDTIKVFATRSATNFRWLELPSLDQPITRSAMRSVGSDPLEQMLAAMGQEHAQTRAVQLTSSPQKDRGWTVTQFEVKVIDDEGDNAGSGDDDGGTPESDGPQHPNPPQEAGVLNNPSIAPQQSTSPSSDHGPLRTPVDPNSLGLRNADEFQIMVEFSEPSALPESSQAVTRGGNPAAQIQERSEHAITAAMKTIREMALQTDAMRKGIPGGSQPRMVKVKFGINLDFEVGAFLAKSGVGATMEVELEWARRSDDVLRVLKADTDVKEALTADAE